MHFAKWSAITIAALGLMGASHRQPPRKLTCSVEVTPSDEGSGRIQHVAVGPSGRLAWTDGRPGQIMVRDGRRRVRAAGRSGAGPGEFRTIASLGWSGDTLWAGDGSVPRVQFFNDTGGFLDGVTAVTRAAWAPRPGGHIVGFAPRRLASDLPFAVLRQSAKQEIDSIATWAMVPAPRVRLANGGPRGSPQPFEAETVVGASPDYGTFCGARPDGSAWRLECVNDAGVSIKQVRLSLTGRELTTVLFDSLVTIFSQGRDRADVRRQLTRPRTLPAINDIKVADNGDVWLQRTHSHERMGTWQRVTRSGLEAQEISIAPLTRVLLVTADTAWGVRSDADGLETLMRCALPAR
jgi:hypothetical protein